MDPSHLTQKSTEALHDAQTRALRFGHTEVDGEHLLLALLDQQDGIVPRLLAQAGADPDRLRTALEAELARRPKVTGPGVAPHERTAVLQRFYRSDRDRLTPGSGLGLSIVAAVMRVHGFGMELADAAPGLRVTLHCWRERPRTSRV